jgi:hypothetical protein
LPLAHGATSVIRTCAEAEAAATTRPAANEAESRRGMAHSSKDDVTCASMGAVFDPPM